MININYREAHESAMKEINRLERQRDNLVKSVWLYLDAKYALGDYGVDCTREATECLYAALRDSIDDFPQKQKLNKLLPKHLKLDDLSLEISEYSPVVVEKYLHELDKLIKNIQK